MPKKGKLGKEVTVYIKNIYLEPIDRLIAEGKLRSRSQAVDEGLFLWMEKRQPEAKGHGCY